MISNLQMRPLGHDLTGDRILARHDEAELDGESSLLIDVLANDSATIGFTFTGALDVSGDSGTAIPFINDPNSSGSGSGGGEPMYWFQNLAGGGTIDGISGAEFTFSGLSFVSSTAEGSCATVEWTGGTLAVTVGGVTIANLSDVTFTAVMNVDMADEDLGMTSAVLSAEGLTLVVGWFQGLFPEQTSGNAGVAGSGVGTIFGPVEILSIVAPPEHGTAQIENGQIRYTSDPQHPGTNHSFELPVVRGNTPPRIYSIPMEPAYVGEPWHYQVLALDRDGDALIFEIEAAAVYEFTIDEHNLITWIPGPVHVGNNIDVLTVTVRDGNGGEAEEVISLNVENPSSDGHTPIIKSAPSGPAIVGQLCRQPYV